MTIAAATLISAVQLSTSSDVLYTCPAGTTTVITHAVFTNTDSGALAVTVHVVPQGGFADASTILLSAFSVAAGRSYVSGELIGVTLSPGDTVQGSAGTASKVAVYISGLTQT